MSKVSENFLFQFKAARNVKESIGVINDIKKWLKKKKEQVENVLKELSSSKTVIRVLASSVSEMTMTTSPNKRSKDTDVEILFKPADIKKIRSSWDMLVDYEETIKNLETNIIPQAEERYKNVAGLEKYMKSTLDFLKTCKVSRDKLLSGLKAHGDKHIPESLVKLINKIKEDLSTQLAGRFDSCDIMIYPNIVELKGKNVLAIFCYIQFKGLLDDEDWKKDQFEIVVVAVPDENKSLRYQVQTFEEGKERPNEINLSIGDWLPTAQKVNDRIITSLTERHALNVLKPSSLPVTEQEVKKNKTLRLPVVKDLLIDGQYLKAVLKPSVRTRVVAEEIGKKLHPLVKAFFKIEPKILVITKAVQEENLWSIYFKLDVMKPSDKRWNFDRSVISEIGTRLSLDSKTMHEVEDAYKKFLFSKRHKIKQGEFPTSLKDVSEYKDSEPEDVPTNPTRSKLVVQPTAKKKTAVPAITNMQKSIQEKLKKKMQDQDKKNKLLKGLESEDMDI
jgi:hypothetical protein